MALTRQGSVLEGSESTPPVGPPPGFQRSAEGKGTATLGPTASSAVARAVAKLRTPSGLTFLLLLAFMVIGGYDRLHDLGSGSIWDDEAQTTLYSLNIVRTGFPDIVARHLINDWAPLYPYIEALSIKALGATNFAFRLPSALLGTALIPPAYLAGRQIRDRYVGIAMAGFIAFSTEYIAWSRQARWYILLVVLFALGLLTALSWYRATNRRGRMLCATALLLLAVAAALASLPLFLLYLPGFLGAALAYFLASRWDSVLRFLGRAPRSGDTPDTAPAPRVPFRLRPVLLTVGAALAVLVVVVVRGPLETFYAAAFTRVIGFPPYPLSWTNVYGTYLLEYYPGIVTLAVLGSVVMARRRSPVEIGLVALCGVSFLSVSLGASLTNGLSPPSLVGGAVFDYAAYERHVLPLLFFLFIPSGVALAEVFRWVLRHLGRRVKVSVRLRAAAPAVWGTAVVLLLIVPGVLVPTDLATYRHPASSPADSLVPWDPFSIDPPYPSALYWTEQANYQLAAEYINAHRVPSDVIASTSTGPVTVYCGPVAYWVDVHAYFGTTLEVHGRATFFQTGSVLVNNTSELEGLLLNSSGWLVSEGPGVNPAQYPNGMNLVLLDFMTAIPQASDNSIVLFHWNRSNSATLLQLLQEKEASLRSLGTNLTSIADWAATAGVTWSALRVVLLPLESSILPYVSNTVLPLAVLVNVFNHRPDLQAAFPQVRDHPLNVTALIQWAYRVASGTVVDSAHSVLAPYTVWYRNHG